MTTSNPRLNGPLSGRAALVTGSTAGLGVAVARALSDAGAFVVVSGRDPRRGAEVLAGIEANGGAGAFVAADLGDPAAVDHLAEAATRAAGGTLDILVNNAALLIAPGPTAELPADLPARAFAVNVLGPLRLTGLLAPAMAARGQGAVVNIGSVSALRATAGGAIYDATKAAVHALTRSWAAEYGPSGVRVNAVAPGPVSTERVAEFADHLAPILARLPGRRASTPEEIGATVVFLASDEVANLHGAIVSVDGGWSAV